MITPTPVTDPVCGMTVNPSTAITVEFEGVAYHFCESACADTFRDDPNRWTGSDPAPS